MAQNTTTSSADILASEVLAGMVEELLAEKGSIMGHEALIKAERPAMGSNVVKFSADGLGGSHALALTAEGSSVADTTLSDATASVTVARYAKSFAFTDTLLAVDEGRLVQERFARDAVISYNQNLINLVAQLGSGFTNSVGSTGVNLTVQNFMDAKTKLEENSCEGRFLAILHPVQFADLQSAMLSVGGSLQYREDSQLLPERIGGQYKGSFLGVDIFVSSLVPTANAGADRAGLMIARGAVVWADALIEPNPQQVMNAGGLIALELERDARAGESAYVSSALMGAAEFQDLAGVGIITDA